MKIVTPIDSFKGSLTSLEVSNAIEKGVQKVFPEAEVIKVPMADGGEGTVQSLIDSSNGEIIRLKVTGPLREQVDGFYGIMGDEKTAVIEMAAASGLPLVPENLRNPLETTTYGTGELIKDALKRGCRKLIIGIGGSATNDAGMGMLQALGFNFFDKNGNKLGFGGKQLEKVVKIDDSEVIKEIFDAKFLIACDVDNPFYGERGASYVYARQKGADDKMVEELDRGLRLFAEVVKDERGIDIAQTAGAGAAGGLGGGFMAFLNAELKLGIDIVIEETKLKEKIEGADFVITGEGRIDFQTAMGKTPLGIARLCKEKDIPVIGLAGGIADDAGIVHEHGISSFFSIVNYPLSLKEAMEPKKAAFFIESSIEEIFRLIKICKDKFSK